MRRGCTVRTDFFKRRLTAPNRPWQVETARSLLSVRLATKMRIRTSNGCLLMFEFERNGSARAAMASNPLVNARRDLFGQMISNQSALRALFRRCRALMLDLKYTGGLQSYIDRKSTRLNSSHANISYAV